MGVTPNESAKWEGGRKNLRFLANKSLYLKKYKHSKSKHQEGPPLIQIVTMRMEMVKEAGADTSPTYKRPWRNYMSVLLKTVTRQSNCLIQKRPRRWKTTPWGEEEQQCKKEKLVGMVMIVCIDDATATRQYHSQGGATLLSLCNPDREFGICILT